MFVDKLTTHQLFALLKEMRLREEEDVRDYPSAYYGQRLRILHKKTRTRRIESIYKDFEVEKIYGKEPTEQDQQKFRKMMIRIYGERYAKELEIYLLTKAGYGDSSGV